MKKFLYLFAFLPLLSFGQIKTTYQAVSPNSGPSMNKNWGGFANIDAQFNLSIPVVSSPSYNNAVPRDGMIMLNKGDSLLYYSLGGTLHKLGGGGGGSGAVYFNSFYFSGLGSLTSPIIPNPNTILQQAYYVHNNAFTFKYDSLQVLNLPVNGFNATNKNYVDGLINSKLDSVYAAGGYIQNSTISGGQQSGATINIDGGIITGTAASILGGGSHGTAIGLNGITFNFSGNGGAITNNSGNNSIDLSTSVSGHYFRFTSEATSTFAPVNANDLVRLTDLSAYSPLLTFTNGLTLSGTTVKFGGTLTGTTTLNTNNNFFNITGTGVFGDNQASLQYNNGGWLMQSQNTTSGVISSTRTQYDTNEYPSLRMGIDASSNFQGITTRNTATPTIGMTVTDQIDNIGLIAHSSVDTTKMGTNGQVYVDSKWVLNRIKNYPHGTGTVTSITPGYGFTSSTPITVSGTLTIDTTKLRSVNNSYSLAAMQTKLNGYASLSASNNFTGGFTSQYNGGSTYPFTSINNVGITNTTASGVGVTIQSNTLSWLTGGFSGSLTMAPTANRTITLPDASGTVALTSGLPAGANPTASITFTPVNGSAPTFTRSDGAPKADSTVIRSVANSYSLSGMQTKLNNYLLKTDTTAMLGNVVHKALNETITGTKTFTPAPLFSAMTNHSVLFAGAGGLLSQDNNNFYYNSGLLSIGTGGDFTGTNTVNIYGQYDAYEPQSAIGTVTSATTFPGVTASTSRGTGTSPLVNNTGDLTGGFSGWGYTQASPAYTYMAGMSISMVGGTSSLGGQLDFYTKADGSTTTTSGLTIKNDQTLALPHYTAAGILHNAVTTGVITSSLVSLTADVSGILPVANGGTGSATQNWVDLTTNQTIATGHKTWTQDQTVNGRFFTGASIIPTVNQVDSIGTPSLMYSRIYTNSLLTSFFIGQGAGGKFSITTGGTTGDILWSLNNTVTNIATFFHTTGDAVFQTTTSPIVDSTAYKMNIYGRTRISQFTAASTNDSLMAFNPTTHALRMTKLVAGTGVNLAYASGNITVSTANTPILQASADLTAQSAAGNVTTFTVGASTATFNISGYINITAVTIDVIEMQVTYTDENNTSQTANFFTQGATSALLSAIGNSVYPPMVIRAKNGTVITVKTTLTTSTGSIQFDTGARVTQM